MNSFSENEFIFQNAGAKMVAGSGALCFLFLNQNIYKNAR